MLSKNYFGRACKNNILVKEKILNYFCTGCPKSAVRGCILNFCIRNEKLGNVKKFQVWSGMGRLSKRQKPWGGPGGGAG